MRILPAKSVYKAESSLTHSEAAGGGFNSEDYGSCHTSIYLTFVWLFQHAPGPLQQ
jgi:hypothetical protein